MFILLNIWNGNSELEKFESKIHIVNVVPKTLQVEKRFHTVKLERFRLSCLRNRTMI